MEASLSRARLSMARPVLGFQKLEHRPWRPYQFYSPRAMRCLRSSSRADSRIVFDCVNLKGPQIGPALVCGHCDLDCLCSLILGRSRRQHPFLFSLLTSLLPFPLFLSNRPPSRLPSPRPPPSGFSSSRPPRHGYGRTAGLSPFRRARRVASRPSDAAAGPAARHAPKGLTAALRGLSPRAGGRVEGATGRGGGLDGEADLVVRRIISEGTAEEREGRALAVYASAKIINEGSRVSDFHGLLHLHIVLCFVSVRLFRDDSLPLKLPGKPSFSPLAPGA
jgi:hypothetical protein